MPPWPGSRTTIIGPPPRGKGGGKIGGIGQRPFRQVGLCCARRQSLRRSAGARVTRITAASGAVCISEVTTCIGPASSTTSRDQPGRNDPARSATTPSAQRQSVGPGPVHLARVDHQARRSVQQPHPPGHRLADGEAQLQTPRPSRSCRTVGGKPRQRRQALAPRRATGPATGKGKEGGPASRIARLIPARPAKVNAAHASQTGDGVAAMPDLSALAPLSCARHTPAPFAARRSRKDDPCAALPSDCRPADSADGRPRSWPR